MTDADRLDCERETTAWGSAMTAASTTQPTERRIPMTYDEWLAWAPESRLSEWVDGEAIEFMPPTIRHQNVIGFLFSLLRLYVGVKRLGLVLASPVEVRLSARASREPDIVFVPTERLDRVERLRIDGAPDLVVEVISDDSVRRDRVTKRDDYAQAGVREYWIVDCRPGRERAEFLALDDAGRYREVPLDDAGRFRSPVIPGFWLDPAWLRADPLPLETECLRAIAPDVFGGPSSQAPAS